MTKTQEHEWETVAPLRWLAAYGYWNGDDANALAADLAELRPIHHAMRGIADPDEWVRALSLIRHQTARWEGPVWITPAADLAAVLNNN